VTLATADLTERRRALLYAALGFCQLSDSPDMPAVTVLKRWLSTWTGIGHIIDVERQGYDPDS